jgi:hypothetical protein
VSSGTFEGRPPLDLRLLDMDLLLYEVSVQQEDAQRHTEAGFAHLCAAAPIPVSSGKTDRHASTTAATE